MAAPTTSTLNDELKELREDFHKSRLEIKDDLHRVQSALSGDIGRIEVSLAELRTQFAIITRSAILGITILTGSLITSAVSGTWSASKLTTKVDLLETRYDKLEASVAKILEQTRPK